MRFNISKQKLKTDKSRSIHMSTTFNNYDGPHSMISRHLEIKIIRAKKSCGKTTELSNQPQYNIAKKVH